MIIFYLFVSLILARDAVVKYAIFGLKRAKQLLGTAEGTEEVFNYIQKVEDLRHCEDPVAAAAIATQNQFTIDHVPGHLLTSQEVNEIFYYLIILSYYGMECLNNRFPLACGVWDTGEAVLF